ncbi:hypothetical protein [Methylorubrum aminovorans]|nr:hypothetical protein [Methylobacterium sp. NI91]
MFLEILQIGLKISISTAATASKSDEYGARWESNRVFAEWGGRPMTSYRFRISGRSRSAGRLIGRVRSELIKAFMEERATSGATVQSVADKLLLERSVINGQLSGKQHLSLRLIADVAWALDREIVFEIRKAERQTGQNSLPDVSTAISRAPTLVGATRTLTSTLPPSRQIRVRPRQTAHKSAYT